MDRSDAHPVLHALESSVEQPMVVVTARAGDEPAGCLVGFWTLGSIDPPRCMVFLSKANRTYEVARRGRLLVVHVLRRGDERIARHFGETTGDDTDKFAGIDWSPGPDGVPVISRLDWFAGRIRSAVDAGDHTGFLLDLLPEACRFSRSDEDAFGTFSARSFRAAHPA
jgi:flavin reductase (DIM6/NTAB) family NADH-FMN oxidoreductase RutF